MTGKPGLIRGNMIKKGATVIDIGMYDIVYKGHLIFTRQKVMMLLTHSLQKVSQEPMMTKASQSL